MSRARIVPGWPATISDDAAGRGDILAISDVHIGFEKHLAQAGDINISGADAAEFIIRDITSLDNMRN